MWNQEKWMFWEKTCCWAIHGSSLFLSMTISINIVLVFNLRNLTRPWFYTTTIIWSHPVNNITHYNLQKLKFRIFCDKKFFLFNSHDSHVWYFRVAHVKKIYVTVFSNRNRFVLESSYQATLYKNSSLKQIEFWNALIKLSNCITPNHLPCDHCHLGILGWDIMGWITVAHE